MRIIIFILFIFSTSSKIFCQDTLQKKEKRKKSLSLQFSGHYKSFFDNRYVKPTPYQPEDNFQLHQYDRFTKIPTGGFNTGCTVTFPLKKHWSFVTGLLFVFRKNIYEINRDSVNNYYINIPQPTIINIFKYDYSYYNLEIPVLLSYKKKKIIFSAGMQLPLFSFYNTKYTYIENQSSSWTNPDWTTTHKTVNGVMMPLLVIPSTLPSIQFYPWQTTPAEPKVHYDMPLILATLQASYDCKIKNYSINPFIGIDIGNRKSFYLQGGIIIPLKQKIK